MEVIWAAASTTTTTSLHYIGSTIRKATEEVVFPHQTRNSSCGGKRGEHNSTAVLHFGER